MASNDVACIITLSSHLWSILRIKFALSTQLSIAKRSWVFLFADEQGNPALIYILMIRSTFIKELFNDSFFEIKFIEFWIITCCLFVNGLVTSQEWRDLAKWFYKEPLYDTSHCSRRAPNINDVGAWCCWWRLSPFQKTQDDLYNQPRLVRSID